MISAGAWRQNQPNTILFVMIDSSGNEITGLGSGYTLQISKSGAAFSASAGTKNEISNGWYKYISTAGEADTPGPVAVRVTDTGAVQQNLEYVVEDRVEAAVPFTYTVTSTVDSTPIENVSIAIYADILAQQIAWAGSTDASGIARDGYGDLPRLVTGTYYIWRVKNGVSFDNPDVETIS